jgi:3-methyladenine DNA glycosylase AlkD
MTFEETMSALEAAGTEQNRKVYARHGVRPAMFGVSFAVLSKLQKKIKTDPALAERLWASGNHDACVLACKIADPAAVKSSTLDAWAKDLDSYVLTDAVALLAAQTPFAEKKIEAWTKSPKEWVASAGWIMLALVAREDAAAPAAKYAAWIPKIEAGLHEAPNRVRYARNNVLIAIGARGEPLTSKAIAAARRLGKVEVDHGETGCKTPDAEAYILKTLARKKVRFA